MTHFPVRPAIASIAILLLVATSAFSQDTTRGNPRVLILLPNTLHVDKPLQAEFRRLEKMMRGKNNWSDIDTTNEMPPNLRAIAANQYRTSRMGTVSAMTGLFIQDGLAIALFQQFPNLLVLVGTDSCPADPGCLKRIASEQSMQFVIGISELSIRGGKQIQQAILRAQLYDAISDSVLLEGTYTGATEDHGPGTPCVEGTMRCALLNSTTELGEDFYRAIYPRIPGVREEYELAQRRYEYLQERLSAGSDTALVGGLLPHDTAMLDRSALYFALANSDTTRFIGLFAEAKDGRSHDESGIIITTDESVGEYANMHTYTIAGAKYQGKWYYEKTDAFYAGDLAEGRAEHLKELMQQGFFQPDAVTPDPNYWKRGSLGAVGGMVGDTVEENLEAIELRDFADMPLLVARQMQGSRDSAREKFESGIRETVVQPLFQKMHMNGQPYSRYDTLYWMKVVPNRDRSLLLVPIEISQHATDSILLAFWLLIPEKGSGYRAYAWNYFPPTPLNTDSGHDAVERISRLIRWNFLYYSIDDERFWSEYVLKREGTGYKYLVPLE